MKERLLSAAVAIPLFVWALLKASPLFFALIWALVVAVAAFEWARLLKFKVRTPYLWGGGIFCGALALMLAQASLMLSGVLFLSILLLALVAWCFLVPFLLRAYARCSRVVLSSRALLLLSALFFLSFALAVFVIYQRVGAFSLLLLLSLVWINDGGAYFVGKFFGKDKFSPKISPNKTWQGFWGGLLLALICAYFYYLFYFKVLVSSGAFVFVVFACWALVFATLGDLFQSMLKRACGVKDSGRIMPGHGGMYDRIDSWLPAITIWVFLFYFFM